MNDKIPIIQTAASAPATDTTHKPAKPWIVEHDVKPFGQHVLRHWEAGKFRLIATINPNRRHIADAFADFLNVTNP